MFAKRYVRPHFSVVESYELTKTNVFLTLRSLFQNCTGAFILAMVFACHQHVARVAGQHLQQQKRDVQFPNIFPTNLQCFFVVAVRRHATQVTKTLSRWARHDFKKALITRNHTARDVWRASVLDQF